MDDINNFHLRPRFYLDIEDTIDNVRQKFITNKNAISPYIFMKIRNYHIQFTFMGEHKKYWSPHMTIDLEEKSHNDKKTTHIRGIFGPDQTLWTFFIFLHFIIGGVFVIALVFTFTNLILKQATLNSIITMILMILCWFLLYFIAKQIRSNGIIQMEELKKEFDKIML